MSIRSHVLRRAHICAFGLGSIAVAPACASTSSPRTDFHEVGLPLVAQSVPQPRRHAVPRFFELGPAVTLGDEAPTDTTAWLRSLLQRGAGSRAALGSFATRSAGAEGDVFVYPETGSSGSEPSRFALVLPKSLPFSSNGLVVAHWDMRPTAFDFGVGQSTTFGNLVMSDAANLTSSKPIRARFVHSGINVQDAEQDYDIEGSDLRLFEHKGIVPGIPVAFERFTVYDRNLIGENEEPQALIGGASAPTFVIGIRPTTNTRWKACKTFDAQGYRVQFVTDDSGAHYFLAAPLSSDVQSYFGNLSTDMVVESAPGVASTAAEEHPATAAFFLNHTTTADVFAGQAATPEEAIMHLEHAGRFLAAFDGARNNLRNANGTGDRSAFLRFFAHAVLNSHRSTSDPRLMTELPYGDAYFPSDADGSSANVWLGSDQGTILQGLIAYLRATDDRSVLDSILQLAEATTEAMTPSGSVWMKTFDEMLLSTEIDDATRRADAFIDNGGVSVAFNHPRLVVRRGYERVPGVTWGAVSAVVDGQTESVEDGRYRFAVDGDSLPKTIVADQESLGVSRLFSRPDGKIRFRESATVVRGVPAARVQETFEAMDSAAVDEVHLGLGDFFEYGDGVNEIAQNRYGFSRMFDGIPLHVGFWMEGLPEPLWGDNFPDGWVDLTERYAEHHSRFLVVFGYDKAQVYYLPQAADAVRVLNTSNRANDEQSHGVGSKDGYRGWASLEIRYRSGAKLAAGERFTAPPVFTTTIWAPLFSADADTIPDEVQALAPLWTDLVEVVKDDPSSADRAHHVASLEDRERARKLGRLLHTSIESDYAYVGIQAAWMATADLLADLVRGAAPSGERSDWQRRRLILRESALRGAEFSLRAMTQLRNRFDLMPAFGAKRYYAYNIAVFDWAFRETGDPRYREAMLFLSDEISTSEKLGGLQVTDPTRANYGGYLVNAQSRASGTNSLDDQGIKLWALRIAYDRTGDSRYRRSAELCIDHWLKVRPEDHQFYGTSRLFDRYLLTGVEQQRTPYGHYALMVGLAAWADLHPRAQELYDAGLKNATQRHGVHAVGVSGAYDLTFPNEGLVQFSTSAELSGTFLWALSLGALPGGAHWGNGSSQRGGPGKRAMNLSVAARP